MTLTVEALEFAVVKPPGLKLVTPGVAPKINVNVVLEVIAATGVVATPMKLTPEAVPPVWVMVPTDALEPVLYTAKTLPA